MERRNMLNRFIKEGEHNKHSDFTLSEKVYSLYQWATEKEGFDSAFIEGCLESYDSYGGLTTKQLAGINNIIDKFEIDLTLYL